MKDPYQIGSDVDWLKHSNEELAALVKKRQRQLLRSRALSLLLLIALGWVLYQFAQHQPLSQLWPF